MVRCTAFDQECRRSPADARQRRQGLQQGGGAAIAVFKAYSRSTSTLAGSFGSASGRRRMVMRRTPSSAHICAEAGSLPRGSITTRAGLGPATRRTVNSGSSATAVPTPTTTASTRARRRCRWSSPRGTVDVFGMPALRRHAPVDRLAHLADHHQVVGCTPWCAAARKHVAATPDGSAGGGIAHQPWDRFASYPSACRSG